jgi:hypothetical protein
VEIGKMDTKTEENKELDLKARFQGDRATSSWDIVELDMGIDMPGHFVFLFWHDERILLSTDKSAEDGKMNEFTYAIKFSEEDWKDIVSGAIATFEGKVMDDILGMEPLYKAIEQTNGTYIMQGF